jgi:hypothetical protein
MPTVFQGRRKTDWSVLSLPRRGLVIIKLLFQFDGLEFVWNMPRFTLNVDTRANAIYPPHDFPSQCIFFTLASVLVSSKFHKLFDSSRWLLLPETSIINAYHNARNKKFHIIDVRTMLYFICSYIPYLTLQQRPSPKHKLLAHPDMRLVPIVNHRQNSHPTSEEEPPLDFTLSPPLS